MKVLIINIDSKLPNLALKKIEKYHIDKGDKVIFDFPLARNIVDQTYVSCIFSWNKRLCDEYKGAEIGGSGYDIIKKLPEEIELVKPHINLGFTTRGCIRHCEFCVVQAKEGAIRIVGDLLDLWDGSQYFINKYGKKQRTIITILDNNILALPKHFKLVCRQAREKKLCLDFNQGLDHRLLNQEIVDEMKTISHLEFRFAFDHPSYKPTVEKAIKLLQKNKINRCFWYVICGYNTTIQEDLDRLNFLRDYNQNAYVQRYNFKDDRRYIPIAGWANQNALFHALTFKEFLQKSEEQKGGVYKTEFKEMFADILN